MGLEVTNNAISSVKNNFFINPIGNTTLPQKHGLVSDKVEISTDISKIITPDSVKTLIKANPEVNKILQEVNIPAKINIETLNSLTKGHLQDTKRIALGITNKLPQAYRQNVDIKTLTQATLLHDVGKILIPHQILNKDSKLTPDEFKIMEKHSELGYELLKPTLLDEKVLGLIKYHHQDSQNNGYPKVKAGFVYDINAQILHVADVYSALRENRSYKASMNKNQALSIIHEEVKTGKIHPQIFKALVDYANLADNSISKLTTKDINKNFWMFKKPA